MEYSTNFIKINYYDNKNYPGRLIFLEKSRPSIKFKKSWSVHISFSPVSSWPLTYGLLYFRKCKLLIFDISVM